MTPQSQKVLDDALALPPMERALLVERILSSFDFPERHEIDEAWATECEDRIDAYDRGDLKSISVQEVFDRLQRRQSQ